ncbi:hypothetical protein FBZ94_101134 [Bradyrhizobium sacchari]|uniref:Uncharacterized protein n=1 Tax=Bradyrhizobium sacchari TaxID=1399419 RepID=A0A560J5Q3_9BRAD|nr:hypothetical protein FBZ94_101134 [Bradyrhizobium sacchari]TWB83698.1 hypothetical protein FBZ95_101134 [Bradyrhizobium sacchari]
MKPLISPNEASRKHNAASFTPRFKGRLKMIALKVIALTLGAGIAVWAYSGDLGADVALAILACLA